MDLQSVVGVTVQCAGIYLITFLSFFMTRSIRRTFLDYWTIAWVMLSVSLTALVIGFRAPASQPVVFPIYLLGEYGFGFMFIAGCRNYARGVKLARRDLRFLAGGVAVALVLSRFTSEFNAMFLFHAAIVSTLFATAFFTLKPARLMGKPGSGLRVMSAALFLLALDFLHYVPVLAYVLLSRMQGEPSYLRYTSIYDLILEILLGFGSVMLVMDDVRQEVEAANRELVAAHDRLEVMARMDPLTEALNRHAFYSLIDNQSGPTGMASGCAVVVDIDNLKPINDSLGHSAGDAAIREVARAIRSVIRADDLLFRWGGDEFLILLFNIPENEARRRVSRLNSVLERAVILNPNEPTPVIVSYGLAWFPATDHIEKAIDEADSAMYARKQESKQKNQLQPD
jgi:diguanylate cyclase (GGDEF)-like protein